VDVEPARLRDRAMLELLYASGARAAELVGLDVDDVDGLDHPDGGAVALRGKGGKERVVPVGRPACEALNAYLVRARPALAVSGGPALFLNARGGRISRQTRWTVVSTSAARAGVDAEISPHSFRHSFATHLLDGGADIRVVQELLGHSSVTTTQVYTLVTVETLREVWAECHPRALYRDRGYARAGRSRREGTRVAQDTGTMDPALFSRAELLGADDPAAGEGFDAIPEPRPLTSHGPATVVAMCNQKGGVGKTTSTINLAAALAEYGRRVLVVDLDPQGALSAGLGIRHHELELTVYNLLVNQTVSTEEVLASTRVEGVDLIPANIDLSAAEIQLVNEVGREQALGRALYPVLDRYDFVLIDCQ